MKAFVIDVGICNGCYCCQIACKDEHVANDWTPYAKPQPDTGHFWLKLNEYIRGTVPKVKMHYVPTLCMHCADAPCMPACPIEGAIYRREDGLVIIDPEKCTGCKNCVDACPYGTIYFNEDLNLAQKCTGCAHLLDDGWKEPRCVDACPTEAIKFGEESEFKDLIAKAEVMKPELGTSPRVYYLNVPKKFVGGTIYDPVAKEVVIGATCTLTGPKNKKRTATTDGFGDFWFEGLGIGKYKLDIEAKGFAGKTISDIDTEKDVNLGDIPLAVK
jgi:Fe-S-cluster-containing dehydrogenase component